VPPVDLKRIEGLIAQLDADDFATRERAFQALVEIGDPAVGPLKRLLEKPPSAEAKRQATRVIEEIGDPAPTPDRKRVLETIDLLERLRTPKTIALLKEIRRDSLFDQFRTEADQALQRIALP